jgi:hypothetical protein
MILLSYPTEQNMKTRNELVSLQDTVELSVVELDQVSGGRRAIEGEIQYLNWVKQFYSPWANINFGGGRTMVA